jgi:hypothetical protein
MNRAGFWFLLMYVSIGLTIIAPLPLMFHVALFQLALISLLKWFIPVSEVKKFGKEMCKKWDGFT